MQLSLMFLQYAVRAIFGVIGQIFWPAHGSSYVHTGVVSFMDYASSAVQLAVLVLT
jgi:hypothetical protein